MHISASLWSSYRAFGSSTSPLNCNTTRGIQRRLTRPDLKQQMLAHFQGLSRVLFVVGETGRLQEVLKPLGSPFRNGQEVARDLVQLLAQDRQISKRRGGVHPFGAETPRGRVPTAHIRPGQETQDRRDGFHPTSASFSSQEACCHASASTRSFLTLTSISLIGRRTDRRQLHHLILFLSVSTLFLFLLGIDMASPGYQEQGLHPRRPTTLIRRLALGAGEWWNCSRFAGGVRRYIEMVHLSFTIPSLIAPLQPVLPPLLFFGFPSFHSTSTA